MILWHKLYADKGMYIELQRVRRKIVNLSEKELP